MPRRGVAMGHFNKQDGDSDSDTPPDSPSGVSALPALQPKEPN